MLDVMQIIIRQVTLSIIIIIVTECGGRRLVFIVDR